MIENVYLFFNSSCEICEYSDVDVNYAIRFTPNEATADLYEVKNSHIDARGGTTRNNLMGYLEFVDKISNNEQVRHGLMEWLWTGKVDEDEVPVLKDSDPDYDPRDAIMNAWDGERDQPVI